MKVAANSQGVDTPRQELPALIRSLLRRRGLVADDAITTFLNPDYAALGDPFLMTDMTAAVKRILKAAKHKQHVIVYGDYDIDGVVSTTLMVEVLRMHGIEPATYIPDRYKEGYGLNPGALEQLKKEGAELIITVDCGITSVAEATWCRENGIDLIITDHHEAPAEIPEAVAVINPRRPGDTYPFKDLAGVGVAFAVARALQQKTKIPAAGQEKWLLDLVAMGTVCDVMPLIGENRILVTYGLLVLRKTRRVGLVALAQSAGLDLGDVRAHHLGFRFGPRLNAAGRLEHANYSLELMTTADAVDAQALAFQLEEMNHQRQLDQERILTEATAQANTYANDSVLVLADKGWTHGIVGIVASKLAEKFEKPVLLLQILGDDAKGSGRSSGGYNLIEGLRSCEDLFLKLGGHHFAAGFTLPTDSIDELREAINADYDSVAAALPAKQNREADVVVDDLADITMEMYKLLEQLEPFGNGNPQPAFGLPKLKVVAVSTVGSDGQHLKLRLSSSDGAICEAIGFNMTEEYNHIKAGQIIDLLCYIRKNVWNGRENLEYTIISLQ